MADTWLDYQKSYCPPWLLGVWGTKWAELLVLVKGGGADLSTRATVLRTPLVGELDTYPHIGRTKRLLRAPNETDDSYRLRLIQSFDLWDVSGTETAIDMAFAAAGLTANVVEDFETGGALGHWARFAVYIDGTGVFSDPPLWDDFDWDDGTRWDFVAADGALVDYLVACIRMLKPAHTRCVGLVIERTGFDTVVVPVDGVVPGLVIPPVPVSIFLDAYLDFYLG